MTAPRDHLIDWLRDAHAMEEQAKSLLSNQIDRNQNYPEALPRLKQHLEETERQREAIEGCLKQLGADTSTLKDMSTKLMANLQGMGFSMSGDEMLKNVLASHAFERFEAACYQSLIAAAEKAGEPRVAEVARDILREEEAMGDWLWDHIQPMTDKYLERSAQDQAAKV